MARYLLEAGYSCDPTGARSRAPTTMPTSSMTPHHPGPDNECVHWMIEERDVLGSVLSASGLTPELR